MSLPWITQSDKRCTYSIPCLSKYHDSVVKLGLSQGYAHLVDILTYIRMSLGYYDLSQYWHMWGIGRRRMRKGALFKRITYPCDRQRMRKGALVKRITYPFTDRWVTSSHLSVQIHSHSLISSRISESLIRAITYPCKDKWFT